MPIIIGTEDDDDLLGTDQDDLISGLEGDDVIEGGAGADIISGGDGYDAVSYEGSSAGVNVNLVLGGIGGDAEGDRYSGIEDIIGSSFNDLLAGDFGSNYIWGGGGSDLIEGAGGDDVLFGGLGDDLLIGGDGDDLMDGGVGEDVLVGGDGFDIVDYSWVVPVSGAAFAVIAHLGTGHATTYDNSAYLGDTDEPHGVEGIIGSAYDDWLEGSADENLLFGGDGDDVLTGGAGADAIIGGNGFDMAAYVGSSVGVRVSICGCIAEYGDAEGDLLDSIEYLFGSSHDDELQGSFGDDTIQGGAGADILDGEDGFDTLSYTHSNVGVYIILANGVAAGGDAQGDAFSNFEAVVGSAWADRLYGGGGNQTIEGGGGNDVLDGGGGIDTVSYENTAGFEFTIDLEAGFAVNFEGARDAVLRFENVIGSASTDEIYGTAGSNVIEGLQGGDGLYGRGGFDTASYVRSTSGVNVSLATGLGLGGHAEGDVLDGFEALLGSTYDDALFGDGADNTLTGGLGADHLDGSGGSDTAAYDSSTAGVTVRLNGGLNTGGDADGDTLFSIENLRGSAFNDVLIGSSVSNVLTGGDGNDFLQGLGGADVLIGGAGRDEISYVASDAGVTVRLFAGTATGGHATGDTLSGIEGVRGSAFSDTLFGSSDSNTLNGREGNDYLEGLQGADYLIGGSGRDEVRYVTSNAGVSISLAGGPNTGGHAQGDVLTEIEGARGSAFADVLSGSSDANWLGGMDGNDRLEGLDGSDTLAGGRGSDTLIGGAGADVMTGDDDADTFVFVGATGADVITDFSVAGGDVVDLDAGLFVDFADVLANASDTAGGLLISKGGVSILLVGVLEAQLSADDFLFGGSAITTSGGKGESGLGPLVLPDSDTFDRFVEQMGDPARLRPDMSGADWLL